MNREMKKRIKAVACLYNVLYIHCLLTSFSLQLDSFSSSYFFLQIRSRCRRARIVYMYKRIEYINMNNTQILICISSVEYNDTCGSLAIRAFVSVSVWVCERVKVKSLKKNGEAAFYIFFAQWLVSHYFFRASNWPPFVFVVIEYNKFLRFAPIKKISQGFWQKFIIKMVENSHIDIHNLISSHCSMFKHKPFQWCYCQNLQPKNVIVNQAQN